MSLTFEDRRTTILGQLDKEGKVHVHMLAKQLKVSTETVRRDLERLEKEGHLRKVYGGAVQMRAEQTEPPFLKRSLMQQREKREIGALAAALIKDGETVLLDNGTTTLEIMRAIKDRAQVTVITNSVPILNCALNEFRGRILFAGGEIDPRVQAATGPVVHRILDEFKANKAFISVGGVSLTDGVTDYDLEEAAVSRKMMQRAEESLIVADHTKFGVTTFAKICPLEEISVLLTDASCPQVWVKGLQERGVEVMTGGKD
ncbi:MULTISPECIES: DeoR/GlpR family DNA-binding transcription regulator [Paenibacillus]|uniref:DeoR/GlpR family DNA-binding transcription regulator n=1 Tax=Paenibacillus TaxID=44249 RepID=UPI002FE0594F